MLYPLGPHDSKADARLANGNAPEHMRVTS
jgi:hypothetical protein